MIDGDGWYALPWLAGWLAVAVRWQADRLSELVRHAGVG